MPRTKKPPTVGTVVDEFAEREISRRADILQRAVDLAKVRSSGVTDDTADLAKRRREVDRLGRLDRAIENVLQKHDAESYAALQRVVERAGA